MAKDKISSPNRVKRSQNDCDSDSEPEPETSTNNEWPRFLVMSPLNEGQSLAKLSPFAVAKGMKGLAGELKDVKVLQSGKILIECSRKQHSDNLLRCKLFVNIPVKVSPHQTLNFCKGVVRSRDLRNCSEAEMLENLKDQGVVEVKRIHITKNSNKILTNTFILKFNVSVLPANIRAGFIRVPVEPFVPNPLRCYNCQSFGHHKDKCKKSQVRARCGQEGHDFSSCGNPVQCVNCKGDHCAYSRECAKWKQEREIQSVKVMDRISFRDAKRKVLARGVPGSTANSFADVVRAPRVETRSVAVQTSITWLQRSRCEYLDGSEVRFDNSQREASTETSGAALSQTTDKKKTYKRKKNEERIPKGQRDPIQVFNKFAALDEDTEVVEDSEKPLPPSRSGKNAGFSVGKQTEPAKQSKEAKPKQGGAATKQVPAKLTAKKPDKPPPNTTKKTSKVPKLKRVQACPDTTRDQADCKTTNPRGHGSRSRSHSPILPPK
jgi:hypothetical protein